MRYKIEKVEESEGEFLWVVWTKSPGWLSRWYNYMECSSEEQARKAIKRLSGYPKIHEIHTFDKDGREDFGW